MNDKLWNLASSNQRQILGNFYNKLTTPSLSNSTTSSSAKTCQIEKYELLEHIVNMMRSGLLISDLTNSEKKILKEALGKDWKQKLQF
jgi:hypothetical protein